MYRFGPFEFDPANQLLRRDGVDTPLRARPMAMLQVLVEGAGQLVTKDTLLERAWPGVVVEENNLQVQVSVLRKVLGATAIATVPGRGYRFTLPVSAASAIAAQPATSATHGDALVGRAADLAVLLDRLRSHRLVTVVGAGGIGKTRLARAAVDARTAAGRVYWVELFTISDPALIAACILDIVAPHAKAADGHAVATIADALKGEEPLLVLDNAEHLSDDVALLVDELMQRAPDVRVLVTSQAPLRLATEQIVRLESLAVAPSGTAADAAAEFGAIALFAARARAADHRFRLDDTNVESVLRICQKLDGIPLALELAAARVPSLGLAGLEQRLDERFRLLDRGPRNAPSRQQTLLAAFDWSVQLLTSEEQRVFRRLAVMQGTFELEEAVAVLRGDDSDEWQLVDAISGLVERSLLTMDASDPPRYSLLETGRAYALARLRDARDHSTIERACEWYEAHGDSASNAESGILALERYSHTLELARLLPPGSKRDSRELEISLKLGPAMQATIGPTHPRCEEIYRASVRLARTSAPDERAFKALWGYWQFLSLSGRDREAAQYADEILALADQLGDDGLALEALHASMTTRDLLGQADVVVEQAQQIIARYDRGRHHRLTFAFGGHDPCVCAFGQGSVNLWLSGQPQLALAMVEKALALGDSLLHGYSRATACYYGAITLWASAQTQRFFDIAQTLVALSDEFRMEMLLTEGRMFVGRARYEQGDLSSIETMRRALAQIEASKDLGFVFVYMAMFADALIETGEYGEAGRLLARGLRYAELGQALFLPEIFRLRGELARSQGNGSSAGDDYAAAYELAVSQNAVALQVRAALAAARAGSATFRQRLPALIERFPADAPMPELHIARELLASGR